MSKLLSATRGAGKLSVLGILLKNLDRKFKDNLVENRNCLFRILIMNEEAHMLTKFMDSVLDGEYYDSERQVFMFDVHALGLTLEDVLYITGLPITGKPVLFTKAFDDQAFFRVFGKFENKTTVPLKHIMEIAWDSEETYPARKIAVLLIVLFSFIAPNNNRHQIDSICVQFVENLEEIDQYAWGAALLAYLYNGIRRYKGEKKTNIDGNLWILLAFFLIRLEKLQSTLKISLKDPPQSVREGGDPWLPWIVREIKKKSYDHYAKYGIDSILPLSEEDINWTPYAGMGSPLARDLDSVRDLVPIFCYNVVVHHKPHHCSRQFPVFDAYDLIPHGWDDYEIKIKQRKCGWGGRNYFALHKKEINAWNARKPTEYYMHYSQSNDDVFDNRNGYNSEQERENNDESEAVCSCLRLKIKELESKLRELEQEHIKLSTYQEKVEDLEKKLKERGKESLSSTSTLQQKIEQLERNLREQEQITDSLLLCKKIAELEEKSQEQQERLQSQQEQLLKLQAQEQQMACTLVDSTNALRSNMPQEANKFERDESIIDVEHYILKSSNSMKRPMSQVSTLPKGRDSLIQTRRRRLSRNSETENIASNLCSGDTKGRQSNPPMLMSRTKPATGSQRPILIPE